MHCDPSAADESVAHEEKPELAVRVAVAVTPLGCRA
jgi:hypothetical protein